MTLNEFTTKCTEIAKKNDIPYQKQFKYMLKFSKRPDRKTYNPSDKEILEKMESITK
jgi:hypothetical protein